VNDVDIYQVGDLRIWRMIIAAPDVILSVNATHNMHEMKIAKWRKTWRDHTYRQIQIANLPQHLARVSFDVVFHFCTYSRRDALNYADTARPIIDAFGPPFVQKPTAKKPQGSASPGWSLIDDDDPVHVEDISLSIGQHWGFRAAANPTAENLCALDAKRGGITIVISERPPLPADHHHVARPKPPAIPAAVRRVAALKGLLG
jgi:hypothetical protein